MRFNDIHIENFRCFVETDIRIEDGVVAVRGNNGAGKSSLLEAICFALYGSRALESGVTLSDVLTTGEDEASVTLDFSHDGTRHKLTREVKRRGGQVSNTKSVLRAGGPVVADGAREVSAHVSDLLHMDADAFANCAYIRQGGVTKLIEATPSERQAIIDDLLRLGKLEEYRERASRARVGAGRVRDSAAGAVENIDAQIEQREREEHDRQRAAVERELARIEAAADTVGDLKADAEKRLSAAEETIEEHAERAERIDEIDEECRGRRDTLRRNALERAERLNDANEAGARAGSARASVAAAIHAADDAVPIEEMVAFESTDTDAETREVSPSESSGATAGVRHDREAIAARIEEAVKTEEAAGERVRQASSDRREASERAATLESECVRAADKAAGKRTAIEECSATIRELTAEINDTARRHRKRQRALAEAERELIRAGHDPDQSEEIRLAARERETALEDRLENIAETLAATRGHIDRVADLAEQDRCPECGSEVDETPHVERLDYERRAADRLEGERDRFERERERQRELAETVRHFRGGRLMLNEVEQEHEEAVEERADESERLGRLKEQVEDLHDRSVEKYRDAAEKREAAAGAAATERQADRQRELARQRAKNLRRLDDALGTLDDALGDVENAFADRDRIADENADLRAEVHALARERAELVAEADDIDIERVRNEAEALSDEIERYGDWSRDLEGGRAARQRRLGEIEGALSDLEDLRERRAAASERFDRLDAFYAEMESLEAMYADVRSSLRERNIDSLERILNDIFDELYRNDAYAGIELDDEYGFTVHEKGGETLTPSQLSGGEKVLFNLSLRCGIYKLLAEGVRGEGSMPPLILDEPTAHLDTGHVNRLSNIVEIMRELGVSQTIIVSHDDEIVDGADDELHLVQDATTNRSSQSVPRAGTAP